MQATEITPQDYIDRLPEDRKGVLARLRQVISSNLPRGFEEVIQYGMITYAVPLSLYPPGYHTAPGQPLPFISLSSQKNYVALYHMGLYADAGLLSWFTDAYSRQVAGKLDMGKSCIRFKKPGTIPYGLLGELASRMSQQQWIAAYEAERKKSGK